MRSATRIIVLSLLAAQLGACVSPVAEVGRLNPFGGRGAKPAAEKPAPQVGARSDGQRYRALSEVDFASGTLTPNQLVRYWGLPDDSYGDGAGDLKYILADKSYIVFPVVPGDEPIHGAVHYSADGTALARIDAP